MKGLLAKEWCVIKNNSVSTFFMILLFAVMGTLGESAFMLAYVAIFLAMIPVNYMTFDETSKWQQYSLSMPFKRSSVVSAKYVVTLLLTLTATVIMAVGLWINMQRNGEFVWEAFALELTLAPAIGILIPSLTFPLNFKFGTGKGRLVMVILIASMGAALGSFLTIDQGAAQDLILKGFTRFSTFQIVPVILAALAVICCTSWLISVWIFEKKDL